MIFSDGYLAPMAVAQALAGDFTHALLDESAHGALVDAAKLLGHPIRKFKHCDAADLARQAARCQRPLVFTDGMFGYDGSVAPLVDYLKCLPASARILVDDAHGVGVLGAKGRGTLEHAGVGRGRIIQCATLSKAFGAYGGVVMGSRVLREQILARSRIFMGTTPLPPPMAGAALAAVKILGAGKAQREKLFANTRWLREALRSGGWEIVEMPGPIVRLPLLPEKSAEALKKRLLAAGIYPPFLKYGNDRQGVFRFVISSKHTVTQLDTVAALLNGFRAGRQGHRTM
jgi:8-amino-7-oxononanoate synthase